MDLNALTAKITKAVDIRKKVKVKGLEFGIGLLTSDEERQINKIVESLRKEDDKEDLSDRIDSMKRYTAAFAIREIDGEEVPTFFSIPVEGTDKTEEMPRSEVLADKLREWPSIVSSALYAAVVDIRKESVNKLKEDIEFDWFEDPDLLEDDEEEAIAESEAIADGIGLLESSEDVVLKQIDEPEES